MSGKISRISNNFTTIEITAARDAFPSFASRIDIMKCQKYSIHKGFALSQETQELPNQIPSFRPVFITSVLLISIGVIGLILLVILTLPTLGPRWLLFFLLTLVSSGLVLPIVYYLHKRFPSVPGVGATVLLREALFAAAYVDLLIWLQFGRVLNFALAVFIAVGFIAVELLIRWRERSQFVPVSRDEE